MFARPAHLADATVATAVGDGWDLRLTSVEYVPLGFGSYHWRGTADGAKWFVTVDDLVAKRRSRADPPDEPLRVLTAALTTAHALAEAGMAFVVAPRRTATDDIVHVIDDRFAIALYSFVDGDAHPWGAYPTSEERLAVLDLLARLHQAPVALRSSALVDDLTITDRDALLDGLGDIDSHWDTGPYGEAARALLVAHGADVRDALDRYDQLATGVSHRVERMVLTHGEPHRGNTIIGANGVLLIDWDTVLIAAPERDLWSLVDEDPHVVHAYRDRAGSMPDDDALECYRLRWTLTEIAMYIAVFRRAHVEDEDTRVAWTGLADSVRLVGQPH